ncbi:MAG: hypothetical protein ACRELG_01775 [Gemmataceae bacterium]
MFVGIQRVMEGTDWPVCAAVYCVGMPGSLNTVVQLLGRAMRLKGEDYPQQHKDRAQLVFFVPCGGGSALADLSLDHSRHALLTCCFLADHEIGQEWIVLRQVHRGIEDALGPREHNPAAPDAENEASEPLAPEVRSEVELALANAREQIISEGREPTLGEVVRQAMQTRSDLPEDAFRQVATEILSAQPEEGAKVGEAIRHETARQLRIHPEVKKAMEEAFAVVLDEFRDVTLKDSTVLESVGRQVHRVTGGQMREFAQRLRQAAPRPLTEEMILGWADTHHTRTDHWPNLDSGNVFDTPNENWVNIDAALRMGLRSLPGGSSLAKLLATERGKRNVSVLSALTEEVILSWADAHYERTGEWPKQESGYIQDAIGEKWRNVHAALAQGLRGLPGGSSLAKLLFEKRGVRTWASAPELNRDKIRKWVVEFFERTGDYPSNESGAISGIAGENWSRIDSALRQGIRGLPSRSSLPQFLEQEFGVRNHMALPPLTVEKIREWAVAYYESNGKYPNQSSGEITGTTDETWSGVNAALRRGIRELDGGYSLAQLLQDEFGVRNIQNLPELTREQIKSWVLQHRTRTGKYPSADSGEILDSNGESWQGVNLAFWVGRRGLPGGSSLAQFLEEEFGLRNHLNLPQLTWEGIREWVVEWYERTGKYPKRNDGEIPGADGETWTRVNGNLMKGGRGLPGASSLPQFLEQEFGVRNRLNTPLLTLEQITELITAWRERTGEFPSKKSGQIPHLHSLTWRIIDKALRRGSHGLPGGSSLPRLLEERFGVKNIQNRSPLLPEQIKAWINAYRTRSGRYPIVRAGEIPGTNGETWHLVDGALRRGQRGLPGGSSLRKFINENCTPTDDKDD